MKARPILFSAPMVRALLDGSKTQTRRVVKPQPVQPDADCHPLHAAKHASPYLDAYCGQQKTPANPRGMSDEWCWWQVDDRQCLPTFRCPYGQPGDLLWVRETWALVNDEVGSIDISTDSADDGACYRATHKHARPEKWRPAIHMPRWASRLTLRITNVGVQRVQDISEEDARAEGCQPYRLPVHPAREALRYTDGFSALWDSINANRGYGWDANPWVWALIFTVEQRNVDDVIRAAP